MQSIESIDRALGEPLQSIPALNSPDQSLNRRPASTGLLYAILAYAAWGMLPIYWKLFGQIPAVEVLSHRMIWSMVLLTGLLVLLKRRSELAEAIRKPKAIALLLATALLLTFNWGLYIYGVNSDRVVETSLGYFINPLASVLLGFVFLKERLTRAQVAAVLLAAVGVGYFVWNVGQVPAIALGLAFSFAFYGLLRKIVPVAPMVGLAIETLLITPIALLLVGYWAATGVGHFGTDWRINLLFVGAGVATSLPLLWFNNAAKRLQLSTLGFCQYLAPSLQLLLGVWLYREPFTPAHAVTFGCIWSALLIFSLSAVWQRSRHH
ncbi:EamA family transporter RarD [Microcoleus sp. FACHB-1515]|uniref:EamA family transporter RarD n=1 Tax=Cyanophyceae TaxID=3028117 RepID=UPI00168480FA|nr:EamA family transporter RarD [Microcoleus sp. FACHB-1515]MBD2089533.1 EamA family transporter RarD [Microcoleus sp. FACHB-1515]